MKIREAFDLNSYNKDWQRQARYGKSNSRYAQVCAIAHSQTGGRCTCCGKPSKELHHAAYASWWQWLKDWIDLLQGKPVKLPIWQPGGEGQERGKMGGLTQGRELPGWSCFPMCRPCHDKIHRHKHWLGFNDDIKHCWSARNRWQTLWMLRLMWQLRRIQAGKKTKRI